MTALLPEGIRDRLAPEAEAAAALTATVMGVVRSHSYARIDPPLVEFEETLAERLGPGTARRDLMRFVDPVTQRTLAVRPDITGQVGRIAATRLAHLPRPLRLGYAGPVLRVRGDQLSPERERLQAGAELIGSDTVSAASEVLSVAVEALAAAGLSGLSGRPDTTRYRRDPRRPCHAGGTHRAVADAARHEGRGRAGGGGLR